MAFLLACAPDEPPKGRGDEPFQGGGVGWIKHPPSDAFAGADTIKIDAGNIYEVVASKVDVAVLGDLENQAFAAISRDDARWYTGAYFTCQEGKTPYLVRALYGHGGTGTYVVSRDGRKLLVEHESLGRSNRADKSALIVNLDFAPDAVFTVVRIAE